MENMFNGCSSLTTLYISSFKLNNNVNTESIFDGYKNLKLSKEIIKYLKPYMKKNKKNM